MSVTKKLRWKRNLNYLRFCHEELEMVTTISNDTGAEFQEFYESYCWDNDIDLAELNRQHSEKLDDVYGRQKAEAASPPNFVSDPNTGEMVPHTPAGASGDPEEPSYEMSKDDYEIHEAFSKLFKKIALAIHPDRIEHTHSSAEREEHAQLFREANRAFDEKKYFILLDIATQLKISTPRNYAQQIRWMKRKTKEIEHQIHKQKSTYNFKFAEAEDDESKKILIKQFLHQLFNI